ncbi:MAG: demethylmenaquinone methyltransferase [Acidimicrobiia bacterium]|nr:MAG: demethylmenaquinone methyltransferase [Acidimicrobiia bacterium]
MSTGEGVRVFARIARRYDLVNRVLSLGREQAWRRAVAEHLPDGRILDLGAGTGAAAGLLGDRLVALDPQPEMLALCRAPARVVGVGEALPFADASFDGVFSAFVFRNLESVDATLEEIRRVLRPGGRAGIVDLTRPARPTAARIHRWGTAVVLPLAGLVVGGGAVGEYRYLHRSLDELPPPERMFESAPLRLVRLWRMGWMGFVYGAVLEKAD